MNDLTLDKERLTSRIKSAQRQFKEADELRTQAEESINAVRQALFFTGMDKDAIAKFIAEAKAGTNGSVAPVMKKEPRLADRLIADRRKRKRLLNSADILEAMRIAQLEPLTTDAIVDTMKEEDMLNEGAKALSYDELKTRVSNIVSRMKTEGKVDNRLDHEYGWVWTLVDDE
jgi:septal ring factor EnvC (AmiA/AmiB activator)